MKDRTKSTHASGLHSQDEGEDGRVSKGNSNSRKCALSLLSQEGRDRCQMLEAHDFQSGQVSRPWLPSDTEGHGHALKLSLLVLPKRGVSALLTTCQGGPRG